ncbi:MAG: amidohydrolase family protein [Vulcanimicrobiota bacterium]
MKKGQADLIISPRYLITMAPGDKDPKQGYSIAINDGVITAIGPSGEVLSLYESKVQEKRDDLLIMPGMINTHGHIAMTGYCGKIPDGQPFDAILFDYMLPLERHFIGRKDFVYLSTLLGCRELAKSGVTTSVEMYYFAGDMIRAFTEVGIRGVIGETLMSEFPTPSGLDVSQALRYIEETHQSLPSGDRTVEIAVAPHAPYSCNDETLLLARNTAARLGIPLIMHAKETPDEGKKLGPGEVYFPASSFYRIRKNVKVDPIVHLGRIGLFDIPRVLLAHTIYLSKSEMITMAKYRVGSSYNGVCNTQIGLDIAPVCEMRKAGIAVGIGTDGPLTNDRLDLASQFITLLCLLRHKYRSCEAITCYEIVQMATLEGARAIGLDNKIGSLEKGKKADLIGIALESDPRTEMYLNNNSVYSMIVKYLSLNNIEYCLVNGKKPALPDEKELRARLKPILKEIEDWKPSLQ